MMEVRGDSSLYLYFHIAKEVKSEAMSYLSTCTYSTKEQYYV
jgi:hypothetical protein